MQRLLVLRHGTTEGWRPGLLDSDRALTDEGRAQGSAVGAWLGAEGWLPDRVIASPARRTRQTSLEVCRRAKIPDSVLTFDARIYDASVEMLAQVVRERAHVGTLLLVGHQPGVGALVMTLAQQMDPLHVPPGTLVSLLAPEGDGPWQVEAVLRPGDLRADAPGMERAMDRQHA